MGDITRRWSAIGVSAAIALIVPRAAVQTQPAPNTAADLATLFAPGGVLQDRNGDGVVDFVNARIVLGEKPSAADVSAAADLAARLGFETMAMNLPLSATPERGTTMFIIGRDGAQHAGLSPLAALAALGPGEGLVSTTSSRGGPAVLVAGSDAAGTMAAAELLAGRLPRVWDPKGPTLAQVADDIKKALAGSGIAAASVSIPAVSVRAGADGIRAIDVSVTVPTAAAVADAAVALRRLTGSPLTAGRSGAARPSRTMGGKTAQTSSPVPARPVGEQAAARALSYSGAAMVRIGIAASGVKPTLVEVLRAEDPKRGPAPPRPGSEAKEKVTLANLFTNDGLLGDSDNNRIPDRFDMLLCPSGEGTEGAVDLAARLGLESTGISIPVALPPDRLEKPDDEPTLVLIGTTHPLVDQLVKDHKFERPPLNAGQGLIQVVKKAFGDKSAVVITGADGPGLARALHEAAERLPHVWARGKDRTTLDDIQEDVRRTLSGRSPAGQAATALYKLDKLAADLVGKDLESAEVVVSIEKPAEGLADMVRQRAAKIKTERLNVIVDNRDVQHAKTIFDESFDIPSEVDDFWQQFRTRVLPKVQKNQPMTVEAGLSESPEMRAQIAGEARSELVKAGAADSGTSVIVLCAYKQGYSWLYDAMRPAVAGKPIDTITIRFARIGPPPEWKQQAMYAPTRWLLEAFPIADVLARDLKIDPQRIRFEEAPIGAPAYDATVTGAGGATIFHRVFEPKIAVRDFFDKFPSYEKVRVETGWLRANSGNRTIVDQRIETDPERFWDHFQSKTLPAIYDHEMAISRGKPRPEDAPFFGELRVDVTMSEPSYDLNIDKEMIAPLESLQEEIYFNTLHFFDVLGREARGPSLDYIGRVVPVVRPRSDGKAGHARITFTGFATDRPAVVVSYREKGGRTAEARLDVPKVSLETPEALAAVVQEGKEGIEQLELRVKVDTQRDERPALVKHARAEDVDRRIMSAEEVSSILGNLGQLRAAGLYKDALAFHDLGGLKIAAAWIWTPDQSTQTMIALDPNGAAAPFPDPKKLLPAGYRYHGEPIVQWDTPIPPPEGHQMLAKMSTFKEATVYKVGESYLGQDIWAMDLMPPIEASHWSQAKATALKPTVVYSARQDANEVSSTSHTLRLAEMLLTDPAFKEALKKVNVVFHPYTNPDGAQLAYDLYKITPDYLLHPGYLGPLGVSLVTRWDSDPIYPESKIRVKLWKTWLPDIFLNPHGYPSHEWVQMFSEYAAWVRNRVTEARDWQQMRGWFIPGFNYLDDPKYPRNKEAAFTIREMITTNINAVPEVRALNQRAYDRYRRYGFGFDDTNFKMEFANGVLIYTDIKGDRADTGTRANNDDDFMVRQPNITIFYGSTEAPDETAHGDWMKLVATMGLQWDKALLQYLTDGHHVVERKETSFFGGAALSLDRPRPPKPEPAASKAQ
jgi:Zinc carboxypeptidase